MPLLEFVFKKWKTCGRIMICVEFHQGRCQIKMKEMLHIDRQHCIKVIINKVTDLQESSIDCRGRS